MQTPLIEIQTPSRLHFGLLAFDPDSPRQFGGVGLMVRQPHLVVRFTQADAITGHGLLSDRAIAFAKRFFDQRQKRPGEKFPPKDWKENQEEYRGRGEGVHLQVVRVPRPHTGLGSGTQLGLAVACGLAHMTGQPNLPIETLASLAGRGTRSAIGAHGFVHGGLIVEGGKASPHQLSPMLMRAHFPDPWRIVLIRLAQFHGLSGKREEKAFAHQLKIPHAVTAELCHLVMLNLIPAVLEQDLQTFGEALFNLQTRIGDCFASAQGGRWGDPKLGEIVAFIRKQGIAGVGQSSWGPSLYAVTGNQAEAEQLSQSLRQAFDLDQGEVLITEADNRGAVVTHTVPSHSH